MVKNLKNIKEYSVPPDPRSFDHQIVYIVKSKYL